MVITTIPSQFVYNFDFPETKFVGVSSSFSYNFFLRDELVNENVSSSIDDKYLHRIVVDGTSSAVFKDVNPINILSRYITLKWEIVPVNVDTFGEIPIGINLIGLENKILKEEEIENLLNFSVISEFTDNNQNTIGLTEFLENSNISQEGVTNATNLPLPNNFNLNQNSNFIDVAKKLLGFIPINIEQKTNTKINIEQQEEIILTEILNEKFRLLGRVSNKFQNNIFNVNNFFGFFNQTNLIAPSSAAPITNEEDNFIADPDDIINIQKVIHEEDFSINNLTSNIEPIGYLIERFEVDLNNNLIGDGRPRYFFKTNPRETELIDTNIKYGFSYNYNIRVLYKIKLVLLGNQETINQGSLYTFFAASRKDSIIINCIDLEIPKTPRDFKIRYSSDFIDTNDNDIIKRGAVISWTIPATSKRNIKGIQVFRRDSLETGFSLLRMFDFNDIIVPQNPQNFKFPNVFQQFITKEVRQDGTITLSNHKGYFVDQNFDINKKYIYALRTVDAHGNLSKLSEQIWVSFDKISKKLICKQISPAGAEIYFPNKYIDENEFKEFINSTMLNRISVFMNPDVFNVNNWGNVTKTNQDDNSYYKLFILNKDINDYEEIKVEINKISD